MRFVLYENNRELVTEKRGNNIVYKCWDKKIGKSGLVNTTWVKKYITEIVNAKIEDGKVVYCDNLVIENGQVVGLRDKSVTSITMPMGVFLDLGDECFRGCHALKSIELSDFLITMGAECFRDCSSLQSIKIPELVTSLGWGCFDSCKSLKSVELSDEITTLDNCCFYSCASLESIKIPRRISSVGDSCFSYCYSLKRIELESNRTDFGKNCFDCCDSLKEIIIHESEGYFRKDIVPKGCKIKWVG